MLRFAQHDRRFFYTFQAVGGKGEEECFISPGRGDIITVGPRFLLPPLPWLVHLSSLRDPTALAAGHIISPAEAGFQVPLPLG